MINGLWLVVAIVASATLTGLIRRYAVARRLIDHPNERSSHTLPTPRGGGLGFVIVIGIGCLGLFLAGLMSSAVLVAIVAGGAAVAVTGFIDDHGHLSARRRLLVHFIAAVWAVVWLGFSPSLPLAGMVYESGWIGQVLAVLGLVWLINLYNFMDGIDAIAAIEGISVAAIAAFILLGLAVTDPASWLALTAAGCFGFLLWNWPPARIFMGDVGSGFLGYVLGVMVYATAHQGLNLWCWVILLGVFLVDATVTLLRRLATRQRWWEPHRSHAYQYAARRWRSHARVSLSVLCINLFWLGPLAWLGAHYPEWAAAVAVVAILPLIVGALALGAGNRELPRASSATVGSEQ